MNNVVRAFSPMWYFYQAALRGAYLRGDPDLIDRTFERALHTRPLPLYEIDSIRAVAQDLLGNFEFTEGGL